MNYSAVLILCEPGRLADVRRRALLKSGLAASAAMTIGLPVSAEEKAAATASEDGIAWHKGVCRFCGTGCGLLVGVKNGRFEPVTWDEAFDEMAKQFKRIYAQKGPSAVYIIGSGQYTIPEAYTASKLMKGGFRSNNIDPNARLCMASAVVGFYQTFGVDEPANHYGDIELADTMILWGNNMAEAHPVLWSRIANR